MALYRRGVGRIRASKTGAHPFEVPTGCAPPHQGYDEGTGLAKEAEVSERMELPSGLVVESYGPYRKSVPSRAAPVELAPAEPEEVRPFTSASPRDWRADFGLARSG